MFRFSIVTFGCRVNQADSFECERALRALGGGEASCEQADVVVVNTCSVTTAADQAARQAIRRIARRNPSAQIVATGCYATRRPDDLAALPGIVRLIPNDQKEHLGAALRRSAPTWWNPTDGGCDHGGGVGFRPGDRGRTVYPLRVQTGCDEACSYCAIPASRGPSRSRSVEDVLCEADALSSAGYGEVVLTGVHLGAYGRDLQPASSLLDLLSALDRAPGDFTIRISSLEPMDCTPALIALVAASDRVARHLHLPLQHASDPILRAMRRPYRLEDYRALTERVRNAMPDAAIGCDVIVGFPGETDGDHEVTLRYLEGSAVTHLHVFPYSDRPGTAAAAMKPKVAASRVSARCAGLRDVARRLHDAFVAGQVGRVRPAITIGDGTLVVTDNYLKVRIGGARARNERVRVRIGRAVPLSGEVVA